MPNLINGDDPGAAPAPATSAAETARTLLQSARTATLATIDLDGGFPFASLVAVATTPDNHPVLLLSELARHTRNLAQDPRASLLFAAAAPQDDPLTAARVTITGRLTPARDQETARARYLAHHPTAAAYAEFGDFSLFEMSPERGHLVAGFGRIVSLAPADLLPAGGGTAGA